MQEHFFDTVAEILCDFERDSAVTGITAVNSGGLGLQPGQGDRSL